MQQHTKITKLQVNGILSVENKVPRNEQAYYLRTMTRPEPVQAPILSAFQCGRGFAC